MLQCNTGPRASARGCHHLLVLATVFICCGSDALRLAYRDGQQDDTSAMSRGGVIDGWLGVGAGGSLGHSSVTSEGGSAGSGPGGGKIVEISFDAAYCDMGRFWAVIGLVTCGESPLCRCWSSPDGGADVLGTVYLDEAGRIIDDSALSGASKQAWIDQLKAYSWPCLAGQAIAFSCLTGAQLN